MNGCHCTVLAGEKDDRIVTDDEVYQSGMFGRSFDIFYTGQVFTNTRAFWLPALSPGLDEFRASLGLTPKILYHITLGNVK